MPYDRRSIILNYYNTCGMTGAGWVRQTQGFAEEAGSGAATGAAGAEQAGAGGTAATQHALPGGSVAGATAGGVDTLSAALRREALGEGAAHAAAGEAEQASSHSDAEQQAGLGVGSAPQAEGSIELASGRSAAEQQAGREEGSGPQDKGRAEQAEGRGNAGAAGAAASGLPAPAAAEDPTAPHGLQVANMCWSCTLASVSEITI